MHFEALSTKYVNFNHFGWFFENFVTKFLFFWQFFLSFLVWEIILLSKNLSILGILHLSYTQREIKKIIFQTSSTCKFASWTWQGKLKQSKFSANRLELVRNTRRICATGNALMQLETILCKFGRICATGNAPMRLKMILCKFGQMSATGNAPMLLETILCEFGQICATGNVPL